MRHVSKTFIMISLLCMVSCEESESQENDASTEESCTLYLEPGTMAGEGTAATSPLSTLDEVMEKVPALRSQCGDAAEVRICGGSFGSEELSNATQALKAAGLKVGSYSKGEAMATPTKTSPSSARMESAGKDGTPSANAPQVFQREIPGRWTDIDDTLSVPTEMAPRSGSTPWWEESGTTNNIYFNGGNVAIGANESAVSRLQINGTECTKGKDIMPVGTLQLRSTNSELMFLDGNEIDSYKTISPWSGTTLHLNYNSKGNITLAQNGGSVGVGASPNTSCKMNVKGTTIGSTGENGSFRIEDTSDSNVLVMDGNEIDGTAGLHLNDKLNMPVYIAANKEKGTNYVYMVRGTGRVGIGNLTENQITHKLTVKGGIKAEEIVVDTVGADFVFEDDYELMTLDDVGKYVEDNHHLPGIAPAKTMQENGVEMGDLQIKLLQKVEELTLYAIEQNKRLKSVEEENRAIQRKCVDN